MNLIKSIDTILSDQKFFYNSGKTKNLQFRLENLNKLKNIIIKSEKNIMDVLAKDLGKSNFESYSTEIGIVLSEITYTSKHLRR